MRSRGSGAGFRFDLDFSVYESEKDWAQDARTFSRIMGRSPAGPFRFKPDEPEHEADLARSAALAGCTKRIAQQDANAAAYGRDSDAHGKGAT